MRAAYHDLRDRRTPGCPIVCGRRHCCRCGRWRLLLDFHVRERDADGEAVAWQPACKTCTRIRTRTTAGLRKRGRPYGPRPTAPTPDELRARRRQQAAERRKDPERIAALREYDRIWQEGKRRAKGVPPRNWGKKSHRVVDVRVEHVYLPRAPLVALIEAADVQIETLARRAGVPQRSITRWRTGESATVRLDCADKIALALGVPLFFVYGDTPLVHGKPRRAAA